MTQPQGAPRDRRVLLVMAVLVIAILAINVISAVVPGMDGALASMPIIVAVLVGGTLLILVRALRN
jgi:hypothetical protein